MQILRKWRRNLAKPLLFALYGAIGCFIASLLLGELWLLFTKLPPSSVKTPQAVVMLIDASGSMSDGKLDEVKTAATKFVQRQNLSVSKAKSDLHQVAVIGFGSNINIATPLTSNLRTIEQAIASLSDGGKTEMSLALETARKEVKQTNLRQNILLFTDGIPNSAYATAQQAEIIRNEQINLVAIATGDADTDFLTELTGDENKVFFTNSGNFDQAFREAEEIIYGKQLVDAGESGDYPLIYGTLRIGGWTSLLALGIALALIMGQNHYLHRRLLSPSELTLGIISSIVAGLIAGSIGQLVYSVSANIPFMAIISRLIGWGLVGTLVGGGMSLFVPNLKFNRGLLGGVIGGVLGAIAFLLISHNSSVVIGRLIGAGILGFFIGLMIALMEQLNRGASLIIHWTKNEKTTISLGENPILLGSSRNAHIYLPQSQGYFPITAKIYTENNQIMMEYDQEYAQAKGMKKIKDKLGDKERRKLGLITLEFSQSKVLK
jgi:Ca-activated chloride channel family protein